MVLVGRKERKVEKMLCVMNVAVLSRHTLMRYETDGGPELVEPRSPPPAPAPLLSSIHGNLGTAAARCRLPAVELETKVKRRFGKISKSWSISTYYGLLLV